MHFDGIRSSGGIYFFPGEVSMIPHLLFYFLNGRQHSKPKSYFTCINTEWIIYKSQLFGIIYAKSVTQGIHKALRMVNPWRKGRLRDEWKVTTVSQVGFFFSPPFSLLFLLLLFFSFSLSLSLTVSVISFRYKWVERKTTTTTTFWHKQCIWHLDNWHCSLFSFPFLIAVWIQNHISLLAQHSTPFCCDLLI